MNIEIKQIKDGYICPYCLGSGKLKAMQSATLNDKVNTKYYDKEVKCKYCDGLGIIINR